MTDLIGIFNADSRKSFSKFSGLRWFLVFEDKQPKLAKKLEFKLKTVSKFKATANFFNFSSFQKKNQFIDLSTFITLHKNMMIQ